MAHQIMLAVIVLGALGIIFAVVLYFVAQKFKVIEDLKTSEQGLDPAEAAARLDAVHWLKRL